MRDSRSLGFLTSEVEREKVSTKRKDGRRRLSVPGEVTMRGVFQDKISRSEQE